jgi:ribosome-associated toxin RatA of RatAB toxin-antitoxin module
VVVTGRHPSFSAARAYEALRDLDSYMNHSPAVRKVTVEETDEGTISHWEVNFRNGILEWSELDVFDDENHSVTFTCRDGDPEYFAGSWSAYDDEDGCHVRFEAEFDIGIPTLSRMLDPLASSTLRENIVKTMQGVMGDELVIDPVTEGVGADGQEAAPAAEPAR